MLEKDIQYSPLISVIIPCYNCEKYLAEALDSVSAQSYTNWECIVVDDGSTDKSKEVALSYTKKDIRFKYIHQLNSGPCTARNFGIKESKGGFIQFLDSDDMIEKEKLKRQVEVFKKISLCDLVYGDMKYFSRTSDGQIEIKTDDEKDWKKGKISGKGDGVIEILLQSNIMVINSPLIKKTVFEKIGLWDEQILFNEDWDIWTRCAMGGLWFQYDDAMGTKALVRVHVESRSRDSFKMYLNGLKVLLKINHILKCRKYRKITNPKIYHHQRVLEKEILAMYNTDKLLSIAMANTLYLEIGLFKYRIFAWLIFKMPYHFCWLYSGFIYLFNRLKCKVIYES